MWRKTAPFVFVLSVPLNLAVAGSWIVGTLGRKATRGCGAHQGIAKIWCPLHRRLGTGGEQWRRIEPGIRTFNGSMRVKCERMRALRAEILDLFAAEHTDREAIAAKQVEIVKGQGEMQKQVIEHLLAQKQVLTPRGAPVMAGRIDDPAQAAGKGVE